MCQIRYPWKLSEIPLNFISLLKKHKGKCRELTIFKVINHFKVKDYTFHSLNISEHVVRILLAFWGTINNP